jgi:hypothetical protein
VIQHESISHENIWNTKHSLYLGDAHRDEAPSDAHRGEAPLLHPYEHHLDPMSAKWIHVESLLMKYGSMSLTQKSHS